MGLFCFFFFWWFHLQKDSIVTSNPPHKPKSTLHAKESTSGEKKELKQIKLRCSIGSVAEKRSFLVFVSDIIFSFVFSHKKKKHQWHGFFF